jgi:hypothetical protein
VSARFVETAYNYQSLVQQYNGMVDFINSFINSG